VTLVDANLLLHAHDPRATQHEASRRWLEGVLSGRELAGFAWLTLWAFLRISTNPRVYERPLSIDEAEGLVQSWLARPMVRILDPGERHWEILRGLICSGQCAGPLVMDAVLAAIAIEHGATLATTDRDFSRFDGLTWCNPLEPA
jgi:toxin-antitoxin system PIN domain toxin